MMMAAAWFISSIYALKANNLHDFFLDLALSIFWLTLVNKSGKTLEKPQK